MTAKKAVKNSLENSLKRLEEIVEILEQGETPLDDAVVLYEEGVQISKACAEKLKAAELKIKKIIIVIIRRRKWLSEDLKALSILLDIRSYKTRTAGYFFRIYQSVISSLVKQKD